MDMEAIAGVLIVVACVVAAGGGLMLAVMYMAEGIGRRIHKK
jgi:hypothetical protein